MINLPHELCYGCTGCLNICPKDAIIMQEDEYGYKYPHIALEKCINCGLCEKVCPELNTYTLKEPIRVLAACSKEEKVLQTTASGGFSFTLARHIIRLGGVVYGCAEKDFETIRHVRVDDIKELELLKNSKYVHSDILHTYREAKNDLKEGRLVLFTGTPCQISGLYGFLRKSYSNLLTMDLVCHGVPPMRMLREQVLSYPEVKGYASEDIRVYFRWKKRSHSGTSIYYGLRTEVRSRGEFKVVREENDIVNAYMACFQNCISLRENCFRCPYARKERISDITVADFWGLGSDIPSNMNVNTGVSLLLINTDKGINFMHEIKDNFIIQEHTFEEASLCNCCLRHPSKSLHNRAEFLKLYRENGLKYATFMTNKLHRFESKPLVILIRKTPLINEIFELTLNSYSSAKQKIKKCLLNEK